MAQAVEPDMAKRNDVSTKMDADVLAECRIVAAFKGISLAEYLSEAMRTAAARDFEIESAKHRTKGTRRKAKPKGDQ